MNLERYLLLVLARMYEPSQTQPSKNSKPDFNNGSQGTDNPLLLIEADTG